MLVTLFGIVIEVRVLQPENAELPMQVTVLGMAVFLNPHTKVFDSVSIIALELFLLSYFLFPFSTITDVRLEQSRKTLHAILVTLLGIVTEVRVVHS